MSFSLAAVVAAVLLPIQLSDNTDLRLASSGTGDEVVEWSLDGQIVATTRDGEPAELHLGAGRHQLWAESESHREWHAVARPDATAEDVRLVPAWSATVPARPADGPIWIPYAAGLVGLAVVGVGLGWMPGGDIAKRGPGEEAEPRPGGFLARLRGRLASGGRHARRAIARAWGTAGMHLRALGQRVRGWTR